MQAAIARQSAPGAAKLRLLSISFDPEYDQREVLAAYAAGMRADPRIWRFARVVDPGNDTAGRRLLAHYQVTVIPDGFGGFEHNAALLVVDAAGRLVRVFDYTELDAALAFARALAARGAE